MDLCYDIMLFDEKMSFAKVTFECNRIDAKYHGMHLDRQLNWKKHICSKRNLRLKLSKTYWLIGRNSQLENKILLYKTILSIWTYGIQLWGTVANSNLEILQRYQSKVLRIIINGPWYYATNDTFHLKISTIKETIKEFYQRYYDRESKEHPNNLTANIMKARGIVRRLERKRSTDLLN